MHKAAQFHIIGRLFQRTIKTDRKSPQRILAKDSAKWDLIFNILFLLFFFVVGRRAESHSEAQCKRMEGLFPALLEISFWHGHLQSLLRANGHEHYSSIIISFGVTNGQKTRGDADERLALASNRMELTSAFVVT